MVVAVLRAELAVALAPGHAESVAVVPHHRHAFAGHGAQRRHRPGHDPVGIRRPLASGPHHAAGGVHERQHVAGPQPHGTVREDGIELAGRIPHHGDATQHRRLAPARGAAARRTHRRRVDERGPRCIEAAPGVVAHGVGLLGGQPQAAAHPRLVQHLAHMVRLVWPGHRDHPPRAVEQHQAGIDGVERIDLLQHGRRGGAAGRVLLLQRARELRGERPPTAIVCALVEIAVQDLHCQRRPALRVPQQGARHHAVKAFERDGERARRLARGGADLGEQRACEEQFAGRHLLAADLVQVEQPVPHRALQRRLDRRGAHGDAAQLFRQQVRMPRHARKVSRWAHALVEGAVQRQQRHAAPARPAIALETLGAPRREQVAAAHVAHHLAALRRGVAGLGQPPAHRQLQDIARCQDGPLAIDQREDRVDVLRLLRALDRGEDRRHLVGQPELQAQHAGGPSLPVHPVRIHQRRRLLAAEAVPGIVLHIGGIAAQHPAQERLVLRLPWVRRRGLGALAPRRRAPQARAQPALCIEEEDVAVHGVLARVGAQAGLDVRALRPMAALAQIARQFAIGGEESDVRRALEQVAHQHVDADLRAGGQIVQAVAQRLAGQAAHEFARQRGEILARPRQVAPRGRLGGQQGERRQQRQMVPRAFDEPQLLLLLLRGGHVAQPLFGG
ncbi:hypothetical protein ACAN107058_13340 [Paracidovorax anthurii]